MGLSIKKSSGSFIKFLFWFLVILTKCLLTCQWYLKNKGNSRRFHDPIMHCSISYLPLNKMAAVSQTVFSDAFSWMQSFIFWLKFHGCLFLRVQTTIAQYWFRQWLGAQQATSHYLNQCWPDSRTHIYIYTCNISLHHSAITQGQGIHAAMETACHKHLC